MPEATCLWHYLHAYAIIHKTNQEEKACNYAECFDT